MEAKCATIGWDNGLSSVQRQVIISTNCGLLYMYVETCEQISAEFG